MLQLEQYTLIFIKYSLLVSSLPLFAGTLQLPKSRIFQGVACIMYMYQYVSKEFVSLVLTDIYANLCASLFTGFKLEVIVTLISPLKLMHHIPWKEVSCDGQKEAFANEKLCCRICRR